MPIIKILPHPELCPNGTEFIATKGVSICKQLLDNNIEIEHACDMVAACTTCHIIVRNGFNSLNEIKEQEEDLLDMAWGLTSVSRLSCQTQIADEDITIEIPKYSINHAKEG